MIAGFLLIAALASGSDAPGRSAEDLVRKIRDLETHNEMYKMNFTTCDECTHAREIIISGEGPDSFRKYPPVWRQGNETECSVYSTASVAAVYTRNQCQNLSAIEAAVRAEKYRRIINFATCLEMSASDFADDARAQRTKENGSEISSEKYEEGCPKAAAEFRKLAESYREGRLSTREIDDMGLEILRKFPCLGQPRFSWL